VGVDHAPDEDRLYYLTEVGSADLDDETTIQWAHATASLARALEVGTQCEIEFWREVLGLYKQIHRLHELQTNAARVDDRTR
jgi:hypothetical protein